MLKANCVRRSAHWCSFGCVRLGVLTCIWTYIEHRSGVMEIVYVKKRVDDATYHESADDKRKVGKIYCGASREAT